MYNVFCECFKRGCLPNSCQRAVLSLLPKNGDLGLLKNWRPVSLMCLDYKILSKCLANRLKNILHVCGGKRTNLLYSWADNNGQFVSYERCD